MKQIIAPATHITNNLSKNFSRNSLRKRWILTLYFCSIGGIVTGLSGLYLSGLAFFEFGDAALHINKLGMWLIMSAFPLVMIGAHALDKISEIDNAAKSENPE
jgi:hypothetical protein